MEQESYWHPYEATLQTLNIILFLVAYLKRTDISDTFLPEAHEAFPQIAKIMKLINDVSHYLFKRKFLRNALSSELTDDRVIIPEDTGDSSMHIDVQDMLAKVGNISMRDTRGYLFSSDEMVTFLGRFFNYAKSSNFSHGKIREALPYLLDPALKQNFDVISDMPLEQSVEYLIRLSMPSDQDRMKDRLTNIRRYNNETLSHFTNRMLLQAILADNLLQERYFSSIDRIQKEVSLFVHPTAAVNLREKIYQARPIGPSTMSFEHFLRIAEYEESQIKDVLQTATSVDNPLYNQQELFQALYEVETVPADSTVEYDEIDGLRNETFIPQDSFPPLSRCNAMTRVEQDEFLESLMNDENQSASRYMPMQRPSRDDRRVTYPITNPFLYEGRPTEPIAIPLPNPSANSLNFELENLRLGPADYHVYEQVLPIQRPSDSSESLHFPSPTQSELDFEYCERPLSARHKKLQSQRSKKMFHTSKQLAAQKVCPRTTSSKIFKQLSNAAKKNLCLSTTAESQEGSKTVQLHTDLSDSNPLHSTGLSSTRQEKERDTEQKEHLPNYENVTLDEINSTYFLNDFSPQNFRRLSEDPLGQRQMTATVRPIPRDLALPVQSTIVLSENDEQADHSQAKPEINGIEYQCNGRVITTYPMQPAEKQHRLPYLAIQFHFSPRCKTNILALWDSGCARSTISSRLYDYFPNIIKERMVQKYIPLGTASTHSFSYIMGEIELCVRLRQHPGDQHPLIFSHNFQIGYNLTKDCYIGSDFISNEHIKSSEDPQGVYLRYPHPYYLNKDPATHSDVKFLPFVYCTTAEITDWTQRSRMVQPFPYYFSNSVITPMEIGSFELC